jgi:hypothetical protein
VNSVQPVRLALTPSPALASLIVLLHGTAAACFLTILTGWLAVAAAALIVALGVAAARDRALLAGSQSPKCIEIWPSGEAYCTFAGGTSAPIEAAPGGAVARHWVSLRLRAPWRRALLVATGMSTADDHRLLRLWALWGRLPAVAWRQRQATL